MAKPFTVAQCQLLIAATAAPLAPLRKPVAMLQERVKPDSRYGSTPRSSDGPGSGKRAQRRAGVCKRGARKRRRGGCRALLPEAEADASHTARRRRFAGAVVRWPSTASRRAVRSSTSRRCVPGSTSNG